MRTGPGEEARLFLSGRREDGPRQAGGVLDPRKGITHARTLERQPDSWNTQWDGDDLRGGDECRPGRRRPDVGDPGPLDRARPAPVELGPGPDHFLAGGLPDSLRRPPRA